MAVRETIIRYNLIIQKLRKRPASFQEIQDYLTQESDMQGYNFQTSLRTFQRDKDDILSIYKIDIQYNSTQKKYYIDNDNEQPELSENLLAAFDVFNALSVADRVSDAIRFENRRAQGTENMHGLLHAIKNKYVLHFSYEKYEDDMITERTAEPYSLKEFRNRWYLIAKDLKDDIVKSFALDRLSDLDITKKRYKAGEAKTIEQRYRYCFGIVSPNEDEPQEIILSFTWFQGKYIKSLPLHDSQEILVDNDDELRIRLKLFITYDLVMELLSYNEHVRVLQPQSLIEQIAFLHEKAWKQYSLRHVGKTV